MQTIPLYKCQNKIRIVTATSLFDGHDASINIMRRIMQASGAEIIHLGHNRSVQEIVDCAIQEDVQAIAVTSYQGGHLEFFKYMYDLLKEKGANHIRIFGGGGGVILPQEIEELHTYGIERIFSPDQGRQMGLQGMINQVLELADFNPESSSLILGSVPSYDEQGKIARWISILENNRTEAHALKALLKNYSPGTKVPVIGITGTGGAGKSSLIDELVRRFILNSPELKIGIVSVDPSKRKSGGALLGDRIRMNSINHPNIYMRSMATRGANLSLSSHVSDTVDLLKASGADFIILETSGIGQSDTQIVDHCDLSLYVMTPEFGAPSQLEKIDMLDFADFVVINKSDKRGSEDALRDVKKQVQRNRQAFDSKVADMPVFLAHASQFFDEGLNVFYSQLQKTLHEAYPHLPILDKIKLTNQKKTEAIIPGQRVRYLAEIAETVRQYNQEAETQSAIAGELYALHVSRDLLNKSDSDTASLDDEIKLKEAQLLKSFLVG